MKKVAKLIIESSNEYLMMYRGNHPTFGNDPDLPGGTAETGESSQTTVIREVYEEIGFRIESSELRQIFSGSNYSVHDTLYSLFITHLPARPEIKMSWEHSSYEWISKDDFINKAKNANDTYMHMASEVLKSYES